MGFNHDFQRLLRAALMSGLALSTVAMPARAGSLWAFGVTSQILGYGFQPSISDTHAIYNSANAAPDGIEPAGLTYTTNAADGTASLTTLPNALSPGLTGAALFMGAEGAEANVSGSLATGATHKYGSTSYGTDTETTATLGVEMYDYLTFAVGGSGSDTITLDFGLDGNLSLGGEASYSQSIQLELGSGEMSRKGFSGGDVIDTGFTGGWNPGFGYTNDTISGFNFQGSLTVTNGEVLEISYIQQMNCNDSATCDFSNTSQMALNLPSDVSYTSDSGVFLTDVPGQGQSTPEPGSLLLVGLGIVGIGYVRRRRFAR